MLFNSPLSADKADRLVALLDLTKDDRVLDVGCGKGELLIRILEATRASGLGIDNNHEVIAAAKQNAAARLDHARYEFRCADVCAEHFAPESFALAVCVGATHAFANGEAAYLESLKQLARLVRPGGLALIGEGYWKQSPAAEYLQFLGDPTGVYRDHATNIHTATQHGFTVLYAGVSNDDEWDEFEWSHQIDAERAAAREPGNPEIAARLRRRRAWCDAYLRWGRSTMGFGFYLLQRG